MERQYETVIGIEIHVELNTKTKIFCGCSTEFGGEVNTQVCPVCMGIPGTLPVLNKKVVEYAAAIGLATHCQITPVTVFDRKNYFYPDNPQNYQISQLYAPIARDGYVEIDTENGRKRIGIHEMHMEEDAGKLMHDEEGISLIDYNRSGVPLVEIVSEPDMRSEKEAVAYIEALRYIIQYLGVSDCKLQEGSMRADINLSVREAGLETLGTRTEMKNLNSFKAIERAVRAERSRQIALLEAGDRVIQETRRWDDNAGCSYSMRSKEGQNDYRYFPEPDLPPVTITEEWLSEIKSHQPELRDEKRVRYEEAYGLSAMDAAVITETLHMAELFEQVCEMSGQPKKAANWLMGEGMRILKEEHWDAEKLDFPPQYLADLIKLVDDGTINGTTAKEVFDCVVKKKVSPKEYIEEHGLSMVNDEEVLRATVQHVIEENEKSVNDYRNGKEKAIGYLVGQTMKAMKGKANPGVVQKLLKEILG